MSCVSPMRGKEMGIDARYSVGGCAFSGPSSQLKVGGFVCGGNEDFADDTSDELNHIR